MPAPTPEMLQTVGEIRRVLVDYEQMAEQLTVTQGRCTELREENRRLRAELVELRNQARVSALVEHERLRALFQQDSGGGERATRRAEKAETECKRLRSGEALLAMWKQVRWQAEHAGIKLTARDGATMAVKKLADECKRLRAMLEVARQVADKWEHDMAGYPDTADGRVATAAVKLCRRELLVALGAHDKTSEDGAGSSSGPRPALPDTLREAVETDEVLPTALSQWARTVAVMAKTVEECRRDLANHRAALGTKLEPERDGECPDCHLWIELGYNWCPSCSRSHPKPTKPEPSCETCRFEYDPSDSTWQPCDRCRHHPGNEDSETDNYQPQPAEPAACPECKDTGFNVTDPVRLGQNCNTCTGKPTDVTHIPERQAE